MTKARTRAPTILGAGLAGLLAGHIFPSAPILERSANPFEGHFALLRFRTDAVSMVTGIPFRKVRVHKGIWTNGRFVSPNIELANRYSAKVTRGRVTPRSIWDTSAVDRYVAPLDLYDRMVENMRGRIEWGVDAMAKMDARLDWKVISTAPLDAAMQHWLPEETLPKFERESILVERWKLGGVDVHQTIYFPGAETTSYRASITGDILIVESMSDGGKLFSIDEMLTVFGLSKDTPAEALGRVVQKYGKIAPIDEAMRREMIHMLTTTCGVYSVGRFATWRNVLLDDVVSDLRTVKNLIEGSDSYAHRLHYG